MATSPTRTRTTAAPRTGAAARRRGTAETNPLLRTLFLTNPNALTRKARARIERQVAAEQAAASIAARSAGRPARR